MHRWLRWSLAWALLGSTWGCGGESTTPAPTTPAEPPPTAAPPEPPAPARRAGAELPADLPNGLMITYSAFRAGASGQNDQPAPALAEILVRRGGQWQTQAIEDPASNVFHKALVYQAPGAAPGILTLGGSGAAVKLWRREGGAWRAQTLWERDVGGRFSRMRDAEVGDLYGDGQPAIAVATHDQGVVAVIRPGASGFTVQELDHQANTFVHEIELGDLDRDGTLEVYATPSEPNTLEGGAQHGTVVRYVPRTNSGRTVVADLGNRHAKEIWVGDVDGDGRDELYVAVEALTEGSTIREPVEIRRYEHDTPPAGGAVIARIQDRFTRFLTVGDLDGDGRREMVAASFSSGLWLLRPGRDPRGEWSIENIDRASGGFEHASLIADLDADGVGELYVASDEQGELRRYVWINGRPRREVIARREVPRSRMTWNLTPVPVSVVQ
ncbi:MAG: VCBS repeat-containing protein [Sandaracinaceae bacterium]|nr:VCBS repeat-containing protein [Sandaracinaceae bacterium]